MCFAKYNMIVTNITQNKKFKNKKKYTSFKVQIIHQQIFLSIGVDNCPAGRMNSAKVMCYIVCHFSAHVILFAYGSTCNIIFISTTGSREIRLLIFNFEIMVENGEISIFDKFSSFQYWTRNTIRMIKFDEKD